MLRREFIVLLGGAAATTAWLLSARAQQSSGVRRIALLVSGNADHQALKTPLAAFQQELVASVIENDGNF